MTTTNNALTIIDTRAQRITAAHTRHIITTPAVIIPPMSEEYRAALAVEQGHRAAHVRLAAVYRASGLDLMRELADQQQRDKLHEDMPRIAAEIGERQREHDAATAAADILDRIAERTSTGAAQRRAAEQQRDKLRAAAKKATNDIRTLETKMADLTASDRADISQEAALTFYQTGDFKTACKAAGQAITAMRSHNAIDATRTQVTKIDRAEYDRMKERFPDMPKRDPKTHDIIGFQPFHIPHIGRKGVQNGFITYEYRNTKRHQGFYKVLHYATVAPVTFYEAYKDNDESNDTHPADIVRSKSTAVDNQQDAEDLAALAADLAEYTAAFTATERDRLANLIHMMMDTTAAQAGADAVAQYRSENPNGKKAEEAREKAMLDSAFSRMGIGGENARKILQRMREKYSAARAAQLAARQQPNPADIVTKAREDFKRGEAMTIEAANDTESDTTSRAAKAERGATLCRYAAAIITEQEQRSQYQREEQQHHERQQRNTRIFEDYRHALEGWHTLPTLPIEYEPTSSRADMVQAVTTWAATQADKPATVRWTHRPYYIGEAVTVTAAQLEAEAAADRDRIRSHAAETAYMDLRRACRDAKQTTKAEVIEHHRSQRTPATIRTSRRANSAKAAALPFIEAMTAEEIRAWYAATKAEKAEQEAHAARVKAEAKAAEKASKERFAAWKPMTAEQEAAFNAKMEKAEARAKAREAAEAAEAAKAEDISRRRLEAYNAAIRAAYARMNTTYAKATAEQRRAAQAEAEAARAAIK